MQREKLLAERGLVALLAREKQIRDQGRREIASLARPRKRVEIIQQNE